MPLTVENSQPRSGASNRIYWLRHLQLPVTVGIQYFQWRQVIGLHIGSWFIGAIKGYPQTVKLEETPEEMPQENVHPQSTGYKAYFR
jgi:hypothetical protein